MKVKAAVLREIGGPYTIEELELEPPRAHEVLVKYAYTGFCHSDLSVATGRIRKTGLPLVPGHECSGVVEAVGPGVTSAQVGDHVASVWMIPCGDCPTCRAGLGNVCVGNMKHFVSGTMLDGTTRIRDARGNPVSHGGFTAGFSEYAVMPERGVVSVRKDLPLEYAALMACCVPTGWGSVINIAKVSPGDSVAIWGMGGVGLNVLRAAKMRQANPIIAIDIEKDREGIARRMGATHFICNANTDPIPVIQELTDGAGVRFAFEVVGDVGSIVQAWWAIGMAGTLVLVGVMPQNESAALPLTFMPLQQKSILGGLYGSVSTHDDIPRLADLAMSGEMKLDELVAGRFKLEDINDISEKMEKRRLTGRWVCEWA